MMDEALRFGRDEQIRIGRGYRFTFAYTVESATPASANKLRRFALQAATPTPI